MPSPGRPSKDAIWVGRLCMDNAKPRPTERYFRTRQDCRNYLLECLQHHIKMGHRVFVGFDFSFGYPEGFASAIGAGPQAGWRFVWEELSRLIQDGDDNANNRFRVASELNARCGGPSPGPLWGCPKAAMTNSLSMKMPRVGYPYPIPGCRPLSRLRRVDGLETGAGLQPIWKLIGAGSVGGQVLVGIPTVNWLRNHPDLTAYSATWPFETGFGDRPTPNLGPFILHVEIWPGVVADRLDPGIAIRDQAQVRAFVEWLHELDTNSDLGDLFAKPSHLSGEDVKACINEEGWILGAGRNRRTSRKPPQLPLL